MMQGWAITDLSVIGSAWGQELAVVTPDPASAFPGVAAIVVVAVVGAVLYLKQKRPEKFDALFAKIKRKLRRNKPVEGAQPPAANLPPVDGPEVVYAEMLRRQHLLQVQQLEAARLSAAALTPPPQEQLVIPGVLIGQPPQSTPTFADVGILRG